MKFTRYEIQAYTQVWSKDNDAAGLDWADLPREWVPIPQLMPPEQITRDKIEAMRDEDGRFRSLADARSVISYIRSTHSAPLRLREITIQEVYRTLDEDEPQDKPIVTLEFKHA